MYYTPVYFQSCSNLKSVSIMYFKITWNTNDPSITGYPFIYNQDNTVNIITCVTFTNKHDNIIFTCMYTI